VCPSGPVSTYSITSSALASSCGGRSGGDDELECCRLEDRQIGVARTLEDLTGVSADLTKPVQSIGRIAHQPADFDDLAHAGAALVATRYDRLAAHELTSVLVASIG
jgi:hypothetical protein